MANTPATGDVLASLTRLHQRQNSLHDLVNERHDSLCDLVSTLHNATQTALRRDREAGRIDAHPQGYADTLSVTVPCGGRRILRSNDLLDAPQDTIGIGGLGTRVRRSGGASQDVSDQQPHENHQLDQSFEHERETDQIPARPANRKGKERITREPDSDLDEPDIRNTAHAASEDPNDYVVDASGMRVRTGQGPEEPMQATNGSVDTGVSRAKLVSQAKLRQQNKQANDGNQPEPKGDAPLDSASSRRHEEVPQRSGKSDSPLELGITHEHDEASDAHQSRGDKGSNPVSSEEPADNDAAPSIASGHGGPLPADTRFWRYATDAPTITVNDLKKDLQTEPRKRSAPGRYASLPDEPSSARGNSTMRKGSQPAATAGDGQKTEGTAGNGNQAGASSRQNSVVADSKIMGVTFPNLPPRNLSDDLQSTEHVALPAPTVAPTRVPSSTPATSKARVFKLSKPLKSGPTARGRTERVANKQEGEHEANEIESGNDEATVSPPNNHPDGIDMAGGDRYSSSRPRGRKSTPRPSLEQARRHVETEARPAAINSSSEARGARASASVRVPKKAKDDENERTTAGKSRRGKKRPSPAPEDGEEGEGEDGGESGEEEQGKKAAPQRKKKTKVGDLSRLGYDFPLGFKAINR
ncbi:hypothetical protein LTR35_013908 [Friedmanniomyces endolithicus]|uniref:Uncharacterized protein n=1 Tax=Friedmanniomyces endolithicus TaxID=329885 RepID=A0AAN6FBV5_9PEZI|nr:hypothetical protein LTR35_013908 [Friedmanniomyces endolithicus]KAK0273966.1 hypothetical protein LTS00_015608 [Friedmanniomyces endolithicus]KAK0313316.1 hypothetical protein LTR82_013550 [Friedmanniomyces endolithicus]KAK0987832.1 hypothetical protein LTR54_012972 [Friedmanniomyces endolithicus]